MSVEYGHGETVDYRVGKGHGTGVIKNIKANKAYIETKNGMTIVRKLESIKKK